MSRCEGKWLNVWKIKNILKKIIHEIDYFNHLQDCIRIQNCKNITHLLFLLRKNYCLHLQMWLKVALTGMLPGFTQRFNLRISSGCKSGAEVEGASGSAARLTHTHTHTPQDLLVHYTSALLLNMSWKHTWVSSITHFLCNTEVCACVRHSEKKRKEIIH